MNATSSHRDHIAELLNRRLELAQLCDLCLRVPAKRTLEVQELHLPVYHTICLLIEDEFFSC